jgi:hypothetical protein
VKEMKIGSLFSSGLIGSLLGKTAFKAAKNIATGNWSQIGSKVLGLVTKLSNSKFLKSVAKFAPLPSGWTDMGSTGALSSSKASGWLSLAGQLIGKLGGQKASKISSALQLVSQVTSFAEQAKQSKINQTLPDYAKLDVKVANPNPGNAVLA